MTDLTGRELGDAVAEALGWERVWRSEGPTTVAMWAWSPAEFPIESDDILTWEGAGLIVESLTTRHISLSVSIRGSDVEVGIRGGDNLEWVTYNYDGDVPTALAQATVDALGGAM